MLALVVDVELFRLALVVVDLLSWMVLLIGAFAAIWRLGYMQVATCSNNAL
jgi:hypothetical protein